MKFFKRLYKYWMIFAKKLSVIPSAIILVIIYFCGISVIAVVNFIMRRDLLDKAMVRKDTYWLPKEDIPADLERSKRQF